MSRFLEKRALPHFWCEGCGNGIVLGALVRALENTNKQVDKTCVVTGIGCTGKLDDYVSCHTVHGTHGRALSIATGIKAANPELTVVALLGDGDGATIGGNHLIHTARRNMGVTAILINNMNYGMTGGQYSGTTPAGSRTSTSYYGDPEPAMDLSSLVTAAGANYVARSTVYHVTQLQKYIEAALSDEGFSFVEAISTCPTYYGRWNQKMSSAEMLASLKERAVPLGRISEVTPPGLTGEFAVGVFCDRKNPGFVQRYAEVRQKAMSTKHEDTASEASCRLEETQSTRWEVVFAGSGGQGLGVAGQLIGEAAVEHAALHSSQVQAYGVAARGGFAKSEVIVSSEEIKYPGVTAPDIVIALTCDAYARYSGSMPAGSTLIYDSDLEGMISAAPEHRSYPMAQVAREIGDARSTNIVALGVVMGLTRMLDTTAMESALRSRFRSNERVLNAFRKGLGLVEA